MFGSFAPDFIGFIQYINGDFQTCPSLRFLDQLLDCGNTVKHAPLAGTRNMAKDAMLNRIVFGTIGRIVSDPNFQPGLVSQRLQVLPEERRLRWVAATAIAQNQ